ncbi:ABC transporter substrate-binding protein [Micromonospora sp. NPDC048830]|uniref:ABC transporter substrate-binding protein n=1 Tax=Micromonospora sp. NPDC048830 TaxID=3364257 RepID=UPI003711044C
MASLVATGLLATACGSDSSGASGEVSGPVTMRVYPLVDEGKDRAFWDGQIAAFKKEHPKVDVKIDIQPWKDRERSLVAAIAGGVAPDLVYMIPDELTQFEGQGVLEPLNGVVDTTGYRENALKAATIDGKLYGAPILMTVIPGACDRKVLAEVGVDKPPTTWDELMAMAPQFKAKGKYVTHVVASNEATLNTSFYPWVWQAGGAPFDDQGKPTIDSPAMVEATRFISELVKQGYVNKDQATVNLPAEQSPIGRREVGCVYYMDPIIMKNDVWGDDTMVAPPLKHKAEGAYGTVGSYAMLKGSKNKKAAAAWLKFITTPQVMADVDKMAGYYPPREDATVEFPAGSVQAEVAKYLELADVGPKVPHAREVQGVIAPEVQAAVLGNKSAEQAMKDAAEAAKSVLER